MRAFLAVLRPLGVIGMVMSLSHLLPLGVSFFHDDGATQAFVISMIVNFAVGCAMWLGTHHNKRDLTPRDGILLVVLAWCGGAAFATLPLLLAIPGLNFTDAYFETMSGLTTTGSTVEPVRGTTTAITASPKSGCGTPMMAASAISSLATRQFSDRKSTRLNSSH